MTDQTGPLAIAAMPPGSVIITPTQMYAEIRAMAGKVDHLASILDPTLTDIRTDIADVVTDVADHESRIRSLDRRLWIAAVVSASAGAGIAQILPLLGS